MQQSNRQREQESWWKPGFVLFSRLSGWIGGPVILALFVGKWLDQRYHTEPWLFLASVGTAFLLSLAGIVWEAEKAMKEIENSVNALPKKPEELARTKKNNGLTKTQLRNK